MAQDSIGHKRQRARKKVKTGKEFDDKSTVPLQSEWTLEDAVGAKIFKFGVTNDIKPEMARRDQEQQISKVEDPQRQRRVLGQEGYRRTGITSSKKQAQAKVNDKKAKTTDEQEDDK